MDVKYQIKQLLLLFHTELPLITTRPEGKTPIEGEKITLSCNATGNPEPSISWVKDGSPINSKSRIGLSKDNKRLTITNISRTDSGEYQCVARNRVGNDTSNSRVDVLCECRTLFISRSSTVIFQTHNVVHCMLFFGAVYCEIASRMYRKRNVVIVQFLHQNAISNEFINY